MNYRRVMRIPSLRKVTAPLAGVVLVLAGCAAGESAPPAPAGPCAIVANGTPAPKTSAPRPAAGSVTTSRNISTNPEVATGYRKDMTAVHTAHYAVVTANPLATQAACEVLNDGGTAADALVTAQAVLGLVEPQSSGIGGGGFLLYYDAARAPCRPTTAGRSRRRRHARTTCAGSPTPTAPSPSPTPAHPAAPSACPASCGC